MRKVMLLFAFLGLLGMQMFAQKTISGTVTSADDGSTLPGVSVLVKGTTIATVTDIDGKYEFKNVPEDATTLVFSFIGMAPQEVPISGNVVDCSLEKLDVTVGDVIVTALGISKDQKQIGYSATNVGNDDFERNSSVNMMNSLQGKVAGVQITNGGGSPNASTRVIIRGYTSVSGNNNPLYVVDGVPIDNTSRTGNGMDYGNRANDINPADIESMTILKGAAATAQYGPRGASGVIMITTKRGKTNGLSVDFSSSYTTTDILRLPVNQNMFGEGWSGMSDLNENGSWGTAFDGIERFYGRIYNNSRRMKPYSFMPDNVYEFFDYGAQYNNSVSVSGGDDKSTFYISYENKHANGILPGPTDVYSRNSVRANGSRMGKLIEINFSSNFVTSNGNNTPDGAGGTNAVATIYEQLLQMPNDFSIVDLKDYTNDPFNTLDYFFTPYAFNPYFSINENQANFKENRFYGNLTVKLKINKDFNIVYRPGIDMSSYQYKYWEAIVSFTPGTPNDLEGAQSNPGYLDQYNINAVEFNQDLMASYNHKFGDFNVDGILGFQTYQRSYSSLDANIASLVIPNFYNISNTESPKVTSSNESLKRMYAFYGQVSLGYKEYGFLNLTGRKDYSSTLPLDANSFFYPSASISLLINNMLKLDKNMVDLIKVRASWGKAGKDASPYLIYPVVEAAKVYIPYSSVNFPFNGIPSYEVSNQIGNANLKPEITTEKEIGLDLRLFKSRLTVDFAYYDRISDGQILPVTIPTSSGYSTQVVNFGKIQNKGVEILVSGTPIKTDKFSWNLIVNFTKNYNKVLELPDTNTEIVLASAYQVQMVAKVGEPLGVIRATDYTYDNEGHIVCNAASGLPIASTDMKVMGTIQPNYTLGITNNFNIYGVDLSFTFDYRPGGLMYSGTADLHYFVGNATQTTFNGRQPFLVPNSVIENPNYDSTVAGSPMYLENNIPVNLTGIGDYYYHTNNPAFGNQSRVIDRTFAKLRNVSVSYTLPTKWYSGLKVKEIQILLSGNNLWLWTPASNNFIDPEETSFGNDLRAEFGEFRASPTLRSFTGTLRIKF